MMSCTHATKKDVLVNGVAASGREPELVLSLSKTQLSWLLIRLMLCSGTLIDFSSVNMRM